MEGFTVEEQTIKEAFRDLAANGPPNQPFIDKFSGTGTFNSIIIFFCLVYDSIYDWALVNSKISVRIPFNYTAPMPPLIKRGIVWCKLAKATQRPRPVHLAT
jgi:membrane-associated phospholipid phosphatase